ncbi:gustatory receptor 68a-like [Diabrotica virgifera virgifera]|uniref:Gustatory receptor n=1 Tax=Diabrotica virgifera virgifera TaxID=50390 RepID=A0ABM5JIW8_DIAVI|nr:gustatory receptor 68a-like [Diabrotica virgifera virgifera]
MFYQWVLDISKFFKIYCNADSISHDIIAAVFIMSLITSCSLNFVEYVYFEDSRPRLSYSIYISYCREIIHCCCLVSCIYFASFHNKTHVIQLHICLKQLCKDLCVKKDPKFPIYLAFLQIACIFSLMFHISQNREFIFLLASYLSSSFRLEIMILSLILHGAIMRYIWLCCIKLKYKIRKLKNQIIHYNLKKRSYRFPSSVTEIFQDFDKVLDLVKLVNKVYGFTLMLYFGYFMISTIKNLLAEFIFGIMFKRGRVLVIPINSYLSGVHVICTVVIISTCTKVTQELKNSALESFELFLHLPLQSYFPEHEELYEDIVVFERYIHEPVYFSAGGFFVIDSSLIFKLMGTITSYLIICLGFDKELIHHFTKEDNSSMIIN